MVPFSVQEYSKYTFFECAMSNNTGEGISILSTDIIFDEDFPSNMHVNEDFLTAKLFLVTTFRVSDWPIAPPPRKPSLVNFRLLVYVTVTSLRNYFD